MKYIILTILICCPFITQAVTWSGLTIKVVPVVDCGNVKLAEGYVISGCFDFITDTITLIQGYPPDVFMHEIGHYISHNTDLKQLRKVFKQPKQTTDREVYEYVANKYVQMYRETDKLTKEEVDYFNKNRIR